MEISLLNKLLLEGVTEEPHQFPHLHALEKKSIRFIMDFGLEELPKEPGILLIRGARQYGKSTWLERALKKTIETFGPGTAFYLNGEYCSDRDELEEQILLLAPLFSKNAPIKRLFIDEITAVPQWEITLKRLVDRGVLSEVLVITTGSKATDLRRAHERLPGRRGKLERTTYLFTPLSYTQFYEAAHHTLKEHTLPAYLISGGSPIACTELITQGYLPEYVIELTRDWIEGEISASGRSRTALFNILQSLFRYGGTPLGQAKLARESGLSNNTMAAGYMELLADLGCATACYPWDPQKKIMILRKACKYHFTNLLVATAYSTHRIRTPQDFLNLPATTQGAWYEWLVAQELQRREALLHVSTLEPLAFWQNQEHEIDFVTRLRWIEVKRGACSPLDFGWFSQSVPNQALDIINQNNFETRYLKGLSLEDFLLENIFEKNS